MSLLSTIAQAVEGNLVRFWSQESRRALARVLFELYHADGEFSPAEQAELDAFSARLGVDVASAGQGDVHAAFEVLAKDPHKKRVAYVWMAAALFADGDFGGHERCFVDDVVKKYGLDEESLRAEIRKYEGRQLAETLNDLMVG